MFPNAIVNVRSGIEGFRQAPSDGVAVINDKNNALGYPQTVNFHAGINCRPGIPDSRSRTVAVLSNSRAAAINDSSGENPRTKGAVL